MVSSSPSPVPDPSLSPTAAPNAQVPGRRVDLRSLAQAHFDTAKWMWWTALGCKAGTVLVGVLVLFYYPATQLGYIAAAVLTLGGELFTFYSDTSKGRSEAMRRNLDLTDSFGGDVPRKDAADLQAETRERILRKLPAEGEAEPYFGSTEPPGPTRALENLLESSWWSRRLSHTMSTLYGWVVGAVVTLAILLLVTTLATATSTAGLDTWAKLGTFLIVSISSLGLVRQLAGYRKFETGAGAIEETAEQLLEDGCDDQIEALRAWQKYHLARTSAPLIPTFIWRLQRDRLNRLWRERNPVRRTP
jgi:hypothetical protein